MRNSGAMHHSRLLAFLLTMVMLFTACTGSAYAGNIWDELTISVLWTDGEGQQQAVPALPVAHSADRAYWVSMPAEALNQTLTVEAASPDPAYTFYFEDEYGGRTGSILWGDEMDAQGLGYEYAYTLFFDVNGTRADMPILLYVSSLPMPEEDSFEPFPVQVRVSYVTEDGIILDSDQVECWAGEITPVWAASAATAGYQLTGDEVVNVQVDENGTASPAKVVFTYRQVATPTPEPTQAPTPTPVADVAIPVMYLHVNGEQLDFQELRLAPGTHIVEASSSKVSGYVPAGETAVQINVETDGSTDLPSIIFYYEDKAPAKATIYVYYIHENGQTLDMQELRLTEGHHVIRPDSDLVAGFELTGADHVEITIFSDGTASMPNVQFQYRDVYAAPVEAVIPVNYIHVDRGVLATASVTLGEGQHLIKADTSLAGEYSPLGNMQMEVTVYADGTFHPGSVEFYFEDTYAAPVTAKLTIIYQLPDGTVVSRDTMTLAPGIHTIVADETKAGGYRLTEEQAKLITVDDHGVISEDVVTFLCRPAAARVTVHYQDERGRDVAPDQAFAYEEDGRYVIHAAPEGLSADYELAPGNTGEAEVVVAGGTAAPADVYFYYRLKQAAPAAAVVTIGYFDTEGVEIAKAQTVTLEAGIHQLTASAQDLPEGYELVSDASITVEVYDNGTYAPQEVAFYYRRIPVETAKAKVVISYRDTRGNELILDQVRYFEDGKHTITPDPQGMPDGYELFSGADSAVEITVRGGKPSVNPVVFYYQKAEVQPKTFKLPVYYYDTLGNQVATTQYVEVAPGSYIIQAKPADLPEGYELMMEEKLPLTVFDDGTTDPEEIAFYYRAPAKMATIIVSYVDAQGRAIIPPFTVELAAGYHTIQAEPSRVPAGFDPRSAEPVQVYVSGDGEAKPDQVTLSFAKMVSETPIPVGEFVYRYATVNGNDVALRAEPSTKSKDTIIKRISKGTKVFVLQENYNASNEIWAMINVDGRTGYMMSKFLDVMTQAQSDAYAAGSTPVPTFTPVPTASPTPTNVPTEEPTVPPTAEPTQAPVEAITPPPTEAPTLEPIPTETAAPTAEPTPTPYTGYALTIRTTALRTGISESEMSIIQNLAANELVTVIDQRPDGATGDMWAIVSTLDKQAGFVQSSSLRPISDEDAQPYLLFWEEMNKTAEPTQAVTPTPEPMQVEGYGVVLGDDVPFRQMASEYSRIIDNLDAGTVVYITGQTAADGQYWHSVNHEGHWGYIRTDLVRMMTLTEEEEYLDRLNATPTPEPVTTNQPFDENGLSSYGYVNGSSVNWRQQPSMKATNVEGQRELKRYAFCLVLGSERVDGVTWYHVRYGEKTGYLHGDFFKQMTISELSDFLGSEEYLQGVANNAASGDTSMDDVGFTGTGGIVSAEDQWVNKNPDVYASFAPFNPIGTPAPIATATPTLEPLPGWATPAPTASPSPTPTFNPLPDVTYPAVDDGKGGNAVAWVVVGGLLLLAVGGAFALVRYQQNRRRIALRAAQRRAQTARAQQAMQQRPYARNAAQGQSRTGAYPNQQTQVRRPVQSGDTTQYTPYTGQYTQSSYRRPEGEVSQDTQPVQRVGRRTAYRQTQQNQQNDEGGSFDA